MKIERELMRGAGPTAVLRLLANKAMYGYELVEALSRQTDGVLAMGQSTLYPMLYNLEAKGYIEAEWRTADSGRDRKYYALTGKGKTRLETDTEAWRALMKAMASIGVVEPALVRALSGRANSGGVSA